MNKETIFRKLYASKVKREQYLDTVPKDIQAAIFDNEYINSTYIDYEMLLQKVFDEHYEAIAWFLYEWKPGFFAVGDVEINNIDQYIEFMKKNEGFE